MVNAVSIIVIAEIIETKKAVGTDQLGRSLWPNRP